MEARPSRGKMLWFNEEKGHGFIETDDGERLYVDVQGFADAPPVGACAGLDVEFRLANGPQGSYAEATRMVTPIAPRRARLRHSR
jgi:cold shock CspA family protein